MCIYEFIHPYITKIMKGKEAMNRRWREKRTWEGLERGERGNYVTIFSFLKAANNKVVTGNFPQPHIGCSSSSLSTKGRNGTWSAFYQLFMGIHGGKEFSTGVKYC